MMCLIGAPIEEPQQELAHNAKRTASSTISEGHPDLHNTWRHVLPVAHD